MEKIKESERWLCIIGRGFSVSVYSVLLKWYKVFLKRGLMK